MSTVRDPREIITPDAFAVAPQLLGLPLARPARRAAAILIDLVIVGIIIKAVGFALFFIAAALLLFRVAKPSQRGGVLRRSAAWMVRAWAVLMLAIFGALAVDRAGDFMRQPRGDGADTPAEQVREEEPRPVPGDAAPARDPAAIRAYLDAAERGDSAQAAQLLDAAQAALAGDRIERLERAQRDLGEQNRQLTTDLERARETRGVRRFVAGLGDDLGVGFGWLAVYFTAFVVLWNGQTPGKRLLGIRIIRLDAKPLSWWIAFERFGGYAASFSTGLLGFAQILWDRNRQGMHDKFIATVVVREAAARAGAAPLRTAAYCGDNDSPGSRRR